MNVKQVVSLLSSAKTQGSGWTARCPAHNDEHNSLKIDTGDKGGVVIYCHAGCTTESVCSAIGITTADLMPQAERPVTQKITAKYDYRDEAGTLLYQACRKTPKGFTQRAPDGKGGWLYSLDGVRRVPFRLPELLAADPNERVFVPEGEEDTLALVALGLVATTNSGGAGKWLPEYSASLKGRHVVILPDNDEAGRKHAQSVAASLHGVAASVGIVGLPGLPKKGDVRDWIAAGGTREALEALCAAAPDWKLEHNPTSVVATAESEKREPIYRPIVTCLADVQPEAIQWLWQDRIALGKLTLLAGDPGLGKSFLSLDLATRVSLGSAWADSSSALAPLGSVILLNAEDALGDTVRPRLDAMGADVTKIVAIEAVQGDDRLPVNLQRDLPAVEKALDDLADCRLVVIDPISAYLGKADSHNNAEIRALLHPLSDLANRRKVAIVCVTHLNKGAGSAIYRATGSLAFVAAARSAWLVAKDPEQSDRRYFLPVKNNLAGDTWGMAFSIVDGVLQWEPKPVQVDANKLLSCEPGTQREADTAADQLRDYLANGAVDASDVAEWAEANGISNKRLQKAKGALRVSSRKTGFNGGWQWTLPSSNAEGVVQVALPEKRDILGIFGKPSQPSTSDDCLSIAT